MFQKINFDYTHNVDAKINFIERLMQSYNPAKEDSLILMHEAVKKLEEHKKIMKDYVSIQNQRELKNG